MQTISVRLPGELKAWLAEKATDEGRSLNRQIIQVVKAAKKDCDKKGDKS